MPVIVMSVIVARDGVAMIMGMGVIVIMMVVSMFDLCRGELCRRATRLRRQSRAADS